jgi:mono/diheme cytochrome c family protein
MWWPRTGSWAARAALVVVTLASAASCQPGVKASKDGAVLFDATCAQCHAHDGSGDPSWKARLDVPDLTDPSVQKRFSDAQLLEIIANGSPNRRMPPWRGVYSDEQLRALVAHVRRLGR